MSLVVEEGAFQYIGIVDVGTYDNLKYDYVYGRTEEQVQDEINLRYGLGLKEYSYNIYKKVK